LLNKYLEISIQDENNLEEILDCISILNANKKIENNALDKLYLLFTIFYKVNDLDIRNEVLIMSDIFVETKYQQQVLKILESRINKITFEECRGYINLIKNTSKKSKKIYHNLEKSLKENRNYYVKHMANELL